MHHLVTVNSINGTAKKYNIALDNVQHQHNTLEIVASGGEAVRRKFGETEVNLKERFDALEKLLIRLLAKNEMRSFITVHSY